MTEAGEEKSLISGENEERGDGRRRMNEEAEEEEQYSHMNFSKSIITAM